jgi:hypothetical protein
MIRYTFNFSQASFDGNGSTLKQVDYIPALSDITQAFATEAASSIRALRR